MGELSMVLTNDDGHEIGNAVADGSEEGDVATVIIRSHLTPQC
jgi:hypothetical protein